MMLEQYQLINFIHESQEFPFFHAIRKGTRKPVAIRMLRKDYPSLDDLVQLQHEYEITKNLGISGVLEPLSLEKEKNSLILVFDDFTGITLRDFLANQRLRMETFLRIAISLANIIGDIHQKKIIHKDIKPENILINPDTLEIKISGFGIATRLSHQTASIQDRHVLEGSLNYISPEQTGRMNRDIDYRTDLYSLGVVLYEMLIGHAPFTSPYAMEIIHCHIAKQPPILNQIDHSIPKAVSDIIHKCLSKAPEDRYHSAYGLKIDLEECLKQLEKTGEILPFIPGQHDVYNVFQIPQKLYGRDQEIDTLMRSFDGIVAGKAEWMLISGYAGVGKTSLVQEVHKPIIRKHGYFISGKFDQLQREIPYTALIEAFKDLVRQVLTESEAELDILRKNLLEVFQSSGQVIVDLIPDLELIIGKQPEISQLDPKENQNRLQIFLTKFILAFAKKHHPLVIFLDDLQWADLASLNILSSIMSDITLQHLLIIGAFRSQEVDPSHPLMATIAEVKKEGGVVSELKLEPLELDHVIHLTSETLHCSWKKSEPLARLMFQKTGGNPFFLIQFFKDLAKKEQITFDISDKEWKWNLKNIESLAISENVIDLMIQKIHQLPKETQNALVIAAVIGVRFQIGLLASILNTPSQNMLKLIWPAITEELIRPIGETAYLIKSDGNSLVQNGKTPFEFLHDRIQQAALSMISEEEQHKIDYRIGRILQQSYSPTQISNHIFEIVSHLNLGHQSITNEEEKLQLASLNLMACKRAKRSAAYASAYDYILIAKELLSPDSWKEQYELTYSIYMECAECSYLSRKFDDMEILSKVILANAKTKIDKGRLYIIRTNYYNTISSTMKASEESLECLRLFGINFKSNPSKLEILIHLLKLKWKLRHTNISELEYLPQMTDLENRFVMKLMMQAGIAAFIADKSLFCLITIKMMELTFDKGICDESFFAYLSYACLHQFLFRDYQTASELGRIAINLSEKYHNFSYKSRANYVMAVIINHWTQPLKTCEKYLEKCLAYGIEAGEVLFMSWICVFFGYQDGTFFRHLSETLQKMDRCRNIIDSCKNTLAMNGYTIKYHIAKLLTREDFDGITLTREGFDESTFLKNVKYISYQAPAFQGYAAYKLLVLYLFRHYEEGLELFEESQKSLVPIYSLITERELNFFHSMTLASLYAKANPLKKLQYKRRIKKNMKLMKIWVSSSPANNAHRYAMLEGEVARMNGEHIAAFDYYDKAIQLAKEQEFNLEEGIAYELAGKLHHTLGNVEAAKEYLNKAHYSYYQWGGNSKLSQLEVLYPLYFSHISSKEHSPSTEKSDFDMEAIFQASSILFGEINLEKLLNGLLKILIEHAGANRILFLMDENNQWLIQAEKSSDQQGAIILQETPLEHHSNDLCMAVIRYVIRTQETIVLNDVLQSGIFTEDPYIKSKQPKSILCLPLIYQGRLSSILYLENTISTDAFTPHRLKILQLLSSQIATSTQNSRLYKNLEIVLDNLKIVNDKLGESNRDLENKVSIRTKELKEKNHQLEDTLESLKEMQKQLITQEKLASLGALTKGVAHEIKNPLNFINNFSTLSLELMEDLMTNLKQGNFDEEEANSLFESLKLNMQKIHQHSQRADGIVMSMLEHSKEAKSPKEVCYLNVLLQRYLILMEEKFVRSHPEIALKVETTFDPQIKSLELYPQDLGKAVTNILENSCYTIVEKYKGKGSFYSPNIRVTTKLKDQFVEIHIQDNGLGISQANMDKIFHPFFTTKPPGAGIGLGLSIAYDIIVKEHNGEIECKTEEGEFTDFMIRLPTN